MERNTSGGAPLMVGLNLVARDFRTTLLSERPENVENLMA